MLLIIKLEARTVSGQTFIELTKFLKRFNYR